MSDVMAEIDKEVKENPVVVYMKGTPRFPMCGFSAATVEVLNEIGVPFKAVDILAEADKREGVKAYTSWPTIPQPACRPRGFSPPHGSIVQRSTSQ